ncbi:unnamed protein product [Allacma fusca]|uniref:Uncharacterized protein n=1 Tax=Allacma fusca TaxID=39272 RepID=A0A8J2K845_9HEXA|nr:unnamed protein product [Allacma fusca]
MFGHLLTLIGIGKNSLDSKLHHSRWRRFSPPGPWIKLKLECEFETQVISKFQVSRRNSRVIPEFCIQA